MVFRHPVLIFITEKHGNYLAYVQKFNSRILSKYTLLLGQEEKSVIQSFTASVDRTFISLMSLSSDGCVYKTLLPVHPSDPEKIQSVVKSLLLKTVVSGNARNGIAFTVLDQDHVAVLGPPLPASKECLSIWNTKFQTLQTSKELPQGTNGQLWCYRENLFMLHGKFLTVIPYKCEVSSLAGALGKLKHSQDPDTHTVPHFVNWETSQGCGLGSQNAEQSKRILRRRKIDVNVQPDVPGSTLFLTIKVVRVTQCFDLFDCHIGDDSLQGTDISIESVSGYSGTVQGEEMEEQTEILQNGFNPEEENFHNSDQELNGKPQNATETTLCPVIPKRAALLRNAILHSAYSETFLLPHLKDIPAQHVTLFLQYLYFLYMKCSENATMTLPGVHPPTLNQILDWMCLLLDANFTVMVMIPEAKKLLLNLSKFVKSQVCICSELNKIEVSFRELQKLNQEKSNRELYSIEVLELF
ncbi:hypothetical protein MC885_009860 [Smutsia gigantea]|nr:hypothetical protein MC885_009860 [Smutsia gigantea]